MVKADFKDFGKGSKKGTRKGMHVRVAERGKPTAYYKYTPGVPLNIYEEIYKAKYIDKQGYTDKPKTLIKEFKTLSKKAKKKWKPRKQWKTAFKPGKKSNEVKINGFGLTEYKIKKAYRELFKPLVADQSILKVITQEENLKQLRTNITHRFKGKNTQGDTILEFQRLLRTTREIKGDLKDLKPKMKISYKTIQNLQRRGFKVGANEPNNILNKLELTIRYEQHG